MAVTLRVVGTANPSRGVVLVLDDDPIMGELLSVVLTRAGFEPRVLDDWRTAVAAATADAGPVVAAICDLQLGTADGAEVLAELQQAVPDLLAIVMSGHPESHIRAALDRAGTHAIVFQKPFRPADLVAVLTAGQPAGQG